MGALTYSLSFTVLSCVTLVAGNKETGNILMLPFPAFSYLYNTIYLGNELKKRGYNITVVLPEGPIQEKITGVIDIDFIMSGALTKSSELSHSLAKTVVSSGIRGSILSGISALPEMPIICQIVGKDKELFEDLQKREFDMVIINMGVLNTCASVIPYRLSVPFIRQEVGITILDKRSFIHPAVYPVNVFVPGSDDMSYTQRIGNTLFYLLFLLKPDVYNPPNVVELFAPQLPRLSNLELEEKTELYLLSYDELIDYHFPVYPNMIPIGGLSTHPAANLTGQLEWFMNSAEDGAVIVSLGSFVTSLPNDVRDKMLGAFRVLAYLKFIFKFGKEVRIDGNVMLMPWIPQNDLLAHRNTKLFITHCGMNANFEALYHAVPVLALPVCLDQCYNAGKMESKGYGTKVNVNDCTKDDLISAIEHVIGTPSYKGKIHNASVIFKNRPQTPAQRAAWWVDHVIKYGGKHLRPPIASLPLHQYMMIDVLVGILIMFTMLCFACFWSFKCLCKAFCKMKTKRD